MKKIILSLFVIFGTCISGFAQRGVHEGARVVAPIKMFDNLHYVGMDWVSAYILETSDGLILIDALYGDFPNDLVKSIQGLGYDMKDIKYILCTHGHYDHNEGAAMLQKLSGARVGMTDIDWRMTEGTVENPYPMENANLVRDLVLGDGDSLTLGNTTLHFYVTPGHTPGVLSFSFPVFDGTESYNAFVFGGAGLNFNGVKRTEMYLHSIDRLLGMKNLLQVNLANHPAMAKIFERGEMLKKRKRGEPNPYVAPEDFQAWLMDLRSQGEKKLIEEKAKE